jgi:hypothetical protein
MTLAFEVMRTRRSFFLVVLPLKKRENLGFSVGVAESAFLPPGELACDELLTIRLPSLRIRSLLCVSTGDQSMSNWLGGGSSVMPRSCGREAWDCVCGDCVEVGEGPEDI